jgi:hypothetical protein
MTPGVKYLVEFPGQLGRPTVEIECSVDVYGRWSMADGRFIPEPKEVARGIYIRLICAPKFVVDAMK